MMKLNRRQLRRLIETSIYEQAEGGRKRVVPEEVREELRSIGLTGADAITALGTDKSGRSGLFILVGKIGNLSRSLTHLKDVYGEDRVEQCRPAKLQGGSAAIKTLGPKGAQRIPGSIPGLKDAYTEDGQLFGSDRVIFVKFDADNLT
jgi:hypothetical protein